MILKYTKNSNDNYINVRQVLKQEFDLSANLIIKLKKNNSILLNNQITYLDKLITNNDCIVADINFDEDNSNIIPTNIKLNILFEDEYLLIIDKLAGMPVHPSIEHYTDSLSNGVKYYFDSLNLHKKIRPVNRIDKNTSGIVIFAKNEYIQECLSKQMKEKVFKKQYIAIVEGKLEDKSGKIECPIARKENSIIERCVAENGEKAVTYYKVINEFNNMTKLEVTLDTGRTHQIRVHMAYIGHPIVGDSLYGNSSNLINRQALHAYKVQFNHPITKKSITLTSPIPEDIKKLE